MTPPKRPRQISEYAQACLDALANSGHGRKISLGGAFGMAHYYEYRTTHDVDAWWIEPVSAGDRQTIIHSIEEALRAFGQVRTRAWGDVVSVELTPDKKAVFSFQIARRSAGLRAPVAGVWPGGIQLDSFDDLVASKMTALVERGAPRDFRDIYTLCQSGQCSINQCWELWTKRQELAGENSDRQRASTAIQTHVARIEQARPLDKITDEGQKTAAANLRDWFLKEFLHGVAN